MVAGSGGDCRHELEDGEDGVSDSEASAARGDPAGRTSPPPLDTDQQDGLIDGAPATPAAAATIFGEHLLAPRSSSACWPTRASATASSARERHPDWDRHVLNCALVHHLIPAGARGQRVIDIGSGAGLPGWRAIARPDLELHLVEPLSRRTGWLSGVTAQLELDNVVIHTARAESMWDRLAAPWVTARAVSGIFQLAQWTLPLLTPRGSLLALKGSRAATELAEHQAALQRLGVVEADVESIGEGVVADPTIVLRVTIGDAIDRRLFRNLASVAPARHVGGRIVLKVGVRPARRLAISAGVPDDREETIPLAGTVPEGREPPHPRSNDPVSNLGWPTPLQSQRQSTAASGGSTSLHLFHVKRSRTRAMRSPRGKRQCRPKPTLGGGARARRAWRLRSQRL